MSEQAKERRDRLVVLSFVSVLLVLIYGPLAPWFVAADRFLYDRFSSVIRNSSQDNTAIVSIDPSRKSRDELLAEYGRLIESLENQQVYRIVLAEPPEMDANDPLPGWAAMLNGRTPVFVPTNHRLADVGARNGVSKLTPDTDQVLRQSRLWHLEDGSMSPSLPLAIALSAADFSADPRVSSTDFVIYHSNYVPVTRLSPDDLLNAEFSSPDLSGKTVFLDSAPELVGAAAILPSGQFVTNSEITAQLLADIELGETIIAPSWVRAMEWTAPALLAILAALFLPARSRRDILLLAAITIFVVIMLEALFLLIGRLRLDLGRAAIIFLGASILSWWLAGGIR